MDFRSEFVSKNTTEIKSLITSVFLAMIPGIIGFGILIAAVTLANWLDISTATEASFQVQTFGLFFVCKTQINNLGTSTPTRLLQCHTREKEASIGLPIYALEQATRSLLIISIILHIPGIIAAIYFGLRRNRREKAALIPAGILLVAAVCAISGMGCYSAFLFDQINDSGVNDATYRTVEPGISFMFGWFGTVCAVISCIICFVSHAIN